MRVKVLNPDEFKNLFKVWGLHACTCYDTPKKYAERVGKSCLETGHFSGSRSTYLTVDISGISRACVDQLARMELGVVKNIQSQRYTFDNFEYYVDPTIEKDMKLLNTYRIYMSNIESMRNEFKRLLEERTDLEGEKINEVARNLNPMAIHTKATFSFNVEALIHLAHERLCTCSQYEIRELVKMICDKAINLVPELRDHLVPKCEYLTWCPESKKRSCKRKPLKIKT